VRGPTAKRRVERTLQARGYCSIAGVDEVGRGALAGPVVAAAVILDDARPLRGLRDSKRLLASERERLALAVAARARAVGVGQADVHEIDALNIYQATLLAMRRALEALTLKPDFVLFDAVRLPGLDVPQRGIVRGDALCAVIAAASIVAKVHRDALMRRLHDDYPLYDFASHKGYGTPVHLEALRRIGPAPVHRRTFAHTEPPLAPAGDC
jgi:ribonuclease HII